ncbi:hypothetical protein KL86PLE_40383 [uncultured Pleomorphomonas sp.]|uniref:Recombinase zinc beta ribbon domain-containing protein n=1 Tax=uncultured Pleomorphomonas sp. TaxID=442121 RepID=A0A212LGF9_9HYPH|nr:hypothetical protein KL86PLE_40383 [uncultured Pleomorphomonas sp.]
MSGLIFCGCCGGPFSIRGADRFACSTHATKGTCSNNRTIPCEELENRVLAGLNDAGGGRRGGAQLCPGTQPAEPRASFEHGDCRGHVPSFDEGEDDRAGDAQAGTDRPARRRAEGHARHASERGGGLC